MPTKAQLAPMFSHPRGARDAASFVHYDTETLVIADSAHPCGGCGAMHFIFINRGGPTLCVGCSIKDSASSGRRDEQ